MADQTPELRRDWAADREKAIKDQIDLYRSEGKDTSHLESLLKGKGGVTTPTDSMVRLGVPAKLKPGTLGPSVVTAPKPDTQAEPADGTAPDKRDQDQSPVPVPGAGNTTTAKDPGPGADGNELPVQVSPPVAVDDETKARAKGARASR